MRIGKRCFYFKCELATRLFWFPEGWFNVGEPDWMVAFVAGGVCWYLWSHPYQYELDGRAH